MEQFRVRKLLSGLINIPLLTRSDTDKLYIYDCSFPDRSYLRVHILNLSWRISSVWARWGHKSHLFRGCSRREILKDIVIFNICHGYNFFLNDRLDTLLLAILIMIKTCHSRSFSHNHIGYMRRWVCLGRKPPERSILMLTNERINKKG